MKRFAALGVGFAVGQILAGTAIGWYCVFVLRRFDPKFSRAPIVAFEIHRDLSIVLALVGVAVIGLVVALGRRRSTGPLLRPLRASIVAGAFGLLSGCLHFVYVEVADRWTVSAHLVWVPPIVCGVASVALGELVARRAVKSA